MIVHCFGQLYEETEPVYGPKCIQLVHLEYLAVTRILSIVGLVNKIEYLGAEAEDRK